jgi:hypothetical protein
MEEGGQRAEARVTRALLLMASWGEGEFGSGLFTGRWPHDPVSLAHEIGHKTFLEVVSILESYRRNRLNRPSEEGNIRNQIAEDVRTLYLMGLQCFVPSCF